MDQVKYKLQCQFDGQKGQKRKNSQYRCFWGPFWENGTFAKTFDNSLQIFCKSSPQVVELCMFLFLRSLLWNRKRGSIRPGSKTFTRIKNHGRTLFVGRKINPFVEFVVRRAFSYFFRSPQTKVVMPSVDLSPPFPLWCPPLERPPPFASGVYFWTMAARWRGVSGFHAWKGGRQNFFCLCGRREMRLFLSAGDAERRIVL